MGTWIQLNVVGLGSVVDARLLPDASVLLRMSDGRTATLTPDAFGSYENGILTQHATVASQLYGNSFILNDGRMAHLGSEFGTGAGLDLVFDPATKSWSSSGPSLQAFHRSTWQWTNGDLTSTGGKRRADMSGRVNFTNENDANSASSRLVERYPALQPDGTRVAYSYLIQPDIIELADLSYDLTPTNVPAVFRNMTAQMEALPRSAEFVGMSATTYRNGFRSLGPSTPFEVGLSMYMPKIGKTILVDGRGSILAYDKATQTVTRPAYLPLVPFSTTDAEHPLQLTSNRQFAPVLRKVNQGNQINESPLQQFIYFNWHPDNNELIPSGIQKMWMRSNTGIHIMTVDFATAGTPLPPVSDKITPFPCVIQRAIVPDDIGNNLVGQHYAPTPVYWYCPMWDARDHGGCILPNGDLIFYAGVGEYTYRANSVGFHSLVEPFKWDGVSPPTMMPAAGTQHRGIAGHMVVLPNGDILTNGMSYHRSTAAEKLPLTEWRPVISSFPTRVRASEVIDLVGVRLNGVHVGSAHGDECTHESNFPVVRFIDRGTSRVYYGRTFDYSERSINPTATQSCKVVVPSSLPDGNFDVEVVASGIPSAMFGVQCINGAFGAVNGGSSVFISGY